MNDYDVALDFMDMTDDRRIWTRMTDVRDGLNLELGQHVIVGDDDAAPAVARVVALDGRFVQVEVLPGGLDANRHLLRIT
jgi:hypothetical protein